jgi:hypothetical protein
LIKNLFPHNAPTQEPQQDEPYNQTWSLWLRHFSGASNQLIKQLQQTDSTLSSAEAQVLLDIVREEAKWAISEFYDVRDAKQTREQAVNNVRMHLPNISRQNLNNLIAYCQYSSER